MHIVSNGSEPPESATDALHSRVLAIEQAIEELSDYAERCRKAMEVSRATIICGGLIFAGTATGLVGDHSAIAVIGGFAAIIGGIVWLGANKSSHEEAQANLQRAQAELAQAIDALGLRRLN